MKFVKQLLFWLAFYTGCIVFVGLLTLDIDVARSSTIFAAIVSCFLLGVYIRKKKWFDNTLKLYTISAFAFIFYFIIGLFFNLNNWATGPTACLLAYSFGFWLAPQRFWFAYGALLSVTFAFYAFFWSPQKYFIQGMMYAKGYPPQIDLSDTSLVWKDASGNNQFDTLRNEVTLVETWSEYCGNCISAMRDLHPFLKEQENKYKNFKHIYLYTRPLKKGETTIGIEKTFKNSHLPYSDMFVLQDENQAFSKRYLPEGLPHFILINQKGDIIFSFQGYNKNFKPTYEHYISSQLKKIAQRN